MRFLFLALLLCWLCLAARSDVAAAVGGGVCLSGENQPRLRRRNESFSSRAVADAAQARAHLSPYVFLGTLRSVLVQRDGTVRAWFSTDSVLKEPGTARRGTRKRYVREYVSVPAVRPSHGRTPTVRRRARTPRPEDAEVVYSRSGRCVLEVNQDNLRLGGQYVVFGVPSDRHSWPSIAASALPVPNDKRIWRAVHKILCEGCAKPPSIEGLQDVTAEERSKARLRCHLTGNPIPWVEWYKDGKIITTRGRIRVKTKRRTSRLVIRRLRKSDAGVYECRAGSVVQKDPVAATASLLVTRRPPPTNTPPSQHHPPTTQSSPWTTEPCREADFCNNGGTCVFYKYVREYVCHCAEGYVGLRCDYKDVRVSVGEAKNDSPGGGRTVTLRIGE